MKRYTLQDYLRDFSTVRGCLEHLRAQRWPDGITCQKCERVTGHHLIESRKCYSCQECGTQTYPTAGTIFHKSRTPLPIWFYIIFQMAQTRCGISAKQIERETGVTYKTAWRLCQLVRAMLTERRSLSGVVEVDETYVGGKPRRKGESKPGRGTKKTPVVGIVERDGAVQTYVVPNVKSSTVLPLIEGTVEPGSTVYTDEYGIYNSLSERGYEHDRVKHRAKEYARGDVHTNSIEGFWSLVKNGITGVYHGVSPKYLDRYVGVYAFRYSHRDDEEPMFLTFLNRAAQSEQHAAMRPDTQPQ